MALGSEPNAVLDEPKGSIVEPNRALVEPNGTIVELNRCVAAPKCRERPFFHLAMTFGTARLENITIINTSQHS